MSNMNCPRCGRDSKAVGSIVERETTQGTFSGTATGLGLGFGGLGVFAGGVSGTTHQATLRAKAMRAPPKASFNWLYVIGPVVIAIGAVVAAQVMPGLMQVVKPVAVVQGDTNVTQIREAFGNMDGLLAPVGLVAALTILTLVVYSLRRRYKQAAVNYIADTQRHNAAKRVYDRLRYCETDHIVFDPVTSSECTASRQDILLMITKVAGGGWESD